MLQVAMMCHSNNSIFKCLPPKLASYQRLTAANLAGSVLGKIVSSSLDAPMKISSSCLYQNLMGQYVNMDLADQWQEEDVILRPDSRTCHLIPWLSSPHNGMICQMVKGDGQPHDLCSRSILQGVLSHYHDMNYEPIVGAELEFYLTSGQRDLPNLAGHDAHMTTLDQLEPFMESMTQMADNQGIEFACLSKESGPHQLEVTLRHGPALDTADRIFVIKQTLVHLAQKQGWNITFMAKPFESYPGNSLHLHQSILCQKTGANIFQRQDHQDHGEKICEKIQRQVPHVSGAFLNFVAGLMKYLPNGVLMLAPYVNSYRRFFQEQSAPSNMNWAHDNRTHGLRLPEDSPMNMRIENRIAGMDANPYLAIATSLACGLLGLKEQSPCDGPANNEGYETGPFLPHDLRASMDLFAQDTALKSLFPPLFHHAYGKIKHSEWMDFHREISPWEKSHLFHQP